MPAELPTVLLVDDENSILDTLRILLAGEGFEVRTCSSGKEALALLEKWTPDLVLTDIRMPGVSGLDLLSSLRERTPELPVLLMTAQASLKSAVRAVNEGAFQYILKPFSNDEVVTICRRAVESGRLKRENTKLKTELRRQESGEATRPVGKSPAFLRVLEMAETVAPTDSTVLISGASGTGKEVLAGYIHVLSQRADGRFLSINCGALPESLLESELFGHVQGSFTGAIRDKDGLFVAARGGTFFLDEVGEMSSATQVKLLRVLQEREVIPVGSTDPVAVDVRIIAASNRDLEDEMRRGGFRGDLFYRLNVISLHLPPLKDRDEDVAILAAHFLARFAQSRGRPTPKLSSGALAALRRYDWPGNVRELENALERAAVLCEGDEISAQALPARITEKTPHPLVSDHLPPNPPLEIIERAYVEWVLRAEEGSRAEAARTLGIDPSTLYRKLQKYGIVGEE
ncbi:MAG: sigma-54-dependent transcriptional regulator [Longimicrobiaceae bacterium]